MDGSFDDDFEEGAPMEASKIALDLAISAETATVIIEIRREMDALDRTSDAYWRHWRAIGERLNAIRTQFPSNAAFGAALGYYEVTLNSHQRSAARRLAELSEEEVESLRARFPGALEPVSLMRRRTELFGGKRKRTDKPSPAEPETAQVPARAEDAGAGGERVASEPVQDAAAAGPEATPASADTLPAEPEAATAEADPAPAEQAVGAPAAAEAGAPDPLIATPPAAAPSASLDDLRRRLAQVERTLMRAAKRYNWADVRATIAEIAKLRAQI